MPIELTNLVKEWAAVEGLVAEPFESENGGGVGLSLPASESAVIVSFSGLSPLVGRPHSLEGIVKSRFTNAVRTLREAVHASD